ncbi:hypothetical protein L6164_036854 [Bauhinia variegata]|uniref:Uncharacterized protein n=1 Tax=Bauhinia variegata TaxID=167791 RepID=A0ACB9KJ31_BAUVA|nr:hypothetical protein L6164_036854 [Bauhinia variegata]
MAELTCYTIDVSMHNDIWRSDSVLMNVLPIIGGQVALVIFLTHLLYYILGPLRQPRLVSDILAGFLLSPNLLGPELFKKIFPVRGILPGETIANMGMAFYIFLTAMEMNPNIMLRAPNKATHVAVAGIIIPMMFSAGIFGLHQVALIGNSPDNDNTLKAYLLWSLALSVTGFPVLVHILIDLKLLYTGLGRVALNAALISDICNWFMFVLLIPFVINGDNGIFSVMSTAVFVVICFYVVRPPLVRLIEEKTEQETWEPQHLLFVVLGALLCAHITDTLGTHTIVGAFVYGLILPHGRFADMVIESTDYFVSSIIAPLFFVSCGIRTNFSVLILQEPWYASMGIILLLCASKIFSTFLATSFFGMSARDGMSLGLLMNTKGVLSIVLLNIAWDGKILNTSSYTLMIIAILLMTMVVSPIINVVYKPRKMFAQYKLRTIQKLRIDVELRIVACIHNTRQAMSMIAICEALNPTRVSPLYVFALHLVEVTADRATALVATQMGDASTHSGAQNLTKSQEDFETIANSFETFVDGHEAVNVETLSVFSAYATIHQDVHNIAKEKRAPLILLPFHRHLIEEGTLETTNAAFRDINMNVLDGAPCSVGILVDHGLGSFSKDKMHILMVFIGGADDQEALAIAWRMAGHKGIRLSVVRILLHDDAAKRDTYNPSESAGLLSATVDAEKQKELDDEYVSSFRLKAVNNEDSITYFEKDAHSGDEISTILTDLDKNGYDLYIVGQGRGRQLLALSALLEWSDYPELGAVGDILASNAFGSRSSVLVVQQYGSVGVGSGRTLQSRNSANINNDDNEVPFVKTV